MFKPRVFIGSSVEGLNVAYAVQQNLLHEAEVTVWDQGVFELSRTTMESLAKALADNDFAVFVFSPDDLVRIRDIKSPAVRDNVLFEFGLFIGRLGRERVFFLLPSSGDLHLPSDLLGVTPGRYESTRTDGSMQAATGAVSYQLRLQMKALGPVPGRVDTDTRSDAGAGEESSKTSWVHEFFREKFDSAKIALEKELESKTGDEFLEVKGWILYCELKLRKDGDTEPLLNFAADHADSSRAQSVVASILRFEGHTQKAIQLLTAAQRKNPKDPVLAQALARCHSDCVDNEKVIAELLSVGPDEFPEVAIDLAEALEGDGKKAEALKVIQHSFAKNPSHRELRYKYARIAQDLDEHEVAVYLLNGLTGEDPQSIEYWGYLGNSCLQLDLYDTAFHAYRKAEKLMKVDDSSQWITSNIGNLLTNKGLPTEACEYLERSVKYEPRSEYAHDRLASALKKKAEEEKDFDKKRANGRRKVREASAQILTPETYAASTALLGSGSGLSDATFKESK